jgi:hypothetical protein
VLFERYPAKHQTVKSNAHGPDIDSFAVNFSVFRYAKLWWHKSRRSGGLGGLHLALLVKHLGYAKVDNFQNIVIRDQAVVWFDVSVNDPLGMD